MEALVCLACTAQFAVQEVSQGSLSEVKVGSSRVQVAAIQIAICPGCGLGVQHPLPSETELVEIYKGMEDQAYIDETESRRLSARLGARLLRRYVKEPHGRLLDVGCATGIFLDAAQKEGWDIVGVEPSASMRAHALPTVASRIRAGVFEEQEFTTPFEVISFWDVLEHVRDPLRTLHLAVKALRPGGLLVVNVPNRESILARLMGEHWPLRLPEHLYYFTPDSLQRLLHLVGIEPLGTHLHPVFFRTSYVLRRLKQHLPPSHFFDAITHSFWGKIPLPLLMGELTIFGRKPR